MASAVYVEVAAEWAHKLALSRCHEPGDYDRAMRSLVEGDDRALNGIGYSTLWGFRYRQPKRIFADIYFELKRAYEAMLERQLAALEKDIAEAKAAGTSSHRLGTAEAVVRAARGERA